MVCVVAQLVVVQAQECAHEVTLNDRYMGKVACYFSAQQGNAPDNNSTTAFMELGLFAREFAAHTQIDDTNNFVYLRRGRQTVRLMTSSDVATALQPSASAIDYNGQSVESSMGIKSNGIVYVPLSMLVNLFLGSSNFDNTIEPARFNISTFADNFVVTQATATPSALAQVNTATANTATLGQTQSQINAQVDALATAPASTQSGNQIGQLAQPLTVQQPVQQVPVEQAPVLQTQAQQTPTQQAPTQTVQTQTNSLGEIYRIAKPRIGQHETYTRVAVDLPVGTGYEISVRGNTFVIMLPNMEALGFEYDSDDRYIKDIGYQLIDNTLALVVTTHYLMSSDGYGYKVGTLPPSATRANEVLYVDFGDNITSSAPISSPLYAAAMQSHRTLSPIALQQLQTLLQVSGQNVGVAGGSTNSPETVDYSQELVPNGVQANSVQANSVQVQESVTQDVNAQNIVQDQAQSQALQGIIQNAPVLENPAVQTQVEQVQTGTAVLPNAPLQAAPLQQLPANQQVLAQQPVQQQPTAQAVPEVQTTAVEVLDPQAVQTQTVQAPLASPVEEVIDTPEPVQSAQRQAGFSVVIDPGHGGIDPGANGIVVEEEVVLDVSLRLKDLLEQYGIEVIMTREDDSSLRPSKRADLAARADQATIERNLFVSIHANAARNRDAHGVETWVFGKPLNDALLQNAINENGGGKVGVELTQEMQDSFSAALMNIVSEEQLRYSKILAESIQSQMVKSTGAKDRGIKENYFYVIRNAQSPAVLVEIGFVNHPEEGALLATDEYRDKLASGLFDGIMGFFSVGSISTSDNIANQ